jgi:hypothetical protein
MKKLAPLLPGVVAAGILAALAIAGSSTIPSTVNIDTGDTVTDPVSTDRDFAIAGHVGSPKARCLAKRTVKLRGIYDTETTKQPFDTARTGTHGGFNGIGPSHHSGNLIAGAKAVVPAKNIGTKKHPRKCGSASDLAAD